MFASVVLYKWHCWLVIEFTICLQIPAHHGFIIQGLRLVNVFYINVAINHPYFVCFIKVFDGGVAVLFNGFQGNISTLHLPGHGTKTVKKIKENKQVVNFAFLINSSSKMTQEIVC